MRSDHRPAARASVALPLVVLFAAIVLTGCAPAQPGVAVGDSAPEFTLPSVQGKDVRLSDYQGKPVLLFFHIAVG